MIITFITYLIIIIIYLYHNRQSTKKWKPEISAYTHNGNLYRRKVQVKKWGTSILLGVDSAIKYKFIIKKENAVEKFYKSLGLIKTEVRSNSFSQKYQLMSDNEQVKREFLSNYKAQNIIDQIFKAELIDYIEIVDGLLYVKFNSFKKPKEELKVADLLTDLNRQLSNLSKETTFNLDLGLKFANLTKAFFISVFICSFFAFYLRDSIPVKGLYEYQLGYWFWHMMKYAALFFIGYLALILVFFRSSSYGPRILNHLFTFGLISTILGSLIFGEFLNFSYPDNSKDEPIIVYAAAKEQRIEHAKKGDRGRLKYYILLQQWQPGIGRDGFVNYSVTPQQYASINTPTQVKLTIKTGLFGLKYFNHIEAIPANN